MTSTEKLEEFRDFVLKDIHELIDVSEGRIDRFMRELQNYEDNITGESRKNKATLIKDKEDYTQFFEDMVSKVQSAKDKLFDENTSRIIYKPSGLSLGEMGSIEGDYAFKLNESLKNVITIFEKRLITESNVQQASNERTTSLPSFTMPHFSAAYELYKGLTKYGYINCKQTEFLNAFEGRIIISQIRWHKANSHLTHFIKRLCSEGIVDDPGDDDRWPLTIKVFCKKDGNRFTISELSGSSSHVRYKGVPNIDGIINSIIAKRRV
jgi:hypothetical protein